MRRLRAVATAPGSVMSGHLHAHIVPVSVPGRRAIFADHEFVDSYCSSDVTTCWIGGHPVRAVSTIRHWQTYFLSCILTTFLIANCAHGQDNEKKVFDIVAEPQRAQLIQRLKLYVEYERTREYEKLYGLLSKTTLERVFKGQSIAEFVTASRKGDAENTSVRILDFTVTNIDKTTKEDADVYNVCGTAKLCEQGKLIEKQIVIYAQLQNGTWYFSTLADVLEN
jgi:hypothetical protein